MIDFIFKFAQDNFFSLYFYFYSDISYDFFYAFILNLFFIFYFLFSLYLLNLITYVRHNFFTSSRVSNFFKFSLSPKIGSKEYRQILKERGFLSLQFFNSFRTNYKIFFHISLGFLNF